MLKEENNLKLTSKKIAFVFFLLGIVVCSPIIYVVAQTSGQMILTGGVYPGAPNYTVWNEGSTYYAKNQYGNIMITGTAQIVSQYVFNLAQGHGKIYFKSGIYSISGLNIRNLITLTDFSQQTLEVYGDGMSETIFRGLTTSVGASSYNVSFTQKAWFMVDSYDNTGIRIYFHDFQIDGVHDSQTNIVSGIVLRNGRDSIIERVFVQRCSGNGISLSEINYSYRGITIRNNQVFDINDPDHIPSLPYIDNCVGINCQDGRADVYISNNLIGWIGTSSISSPSIPYYGIGIALSDSCQAINNVIWAVNHGIETYQDTRDEVILGNYLDFCNTTGIFLDHCSMAICHDNTIRVPYLYGIYLEDTVKTSVQNNKLQMRVGYSCASFINEQPSSNFNSVIGNNAWNEGTITWDCIYISGANTTAANNTGDFP